MIIHFTNIINQNGNNVIIGVKIDYCGSNIQIYPNKIQFFDQEFQNYPQNSWLHIKYYSSSKISVIHKDGVTYSDTKTIAHKSLTSTMKILSSFYGSSQYDYSVGLIVIRQFRIPHYGGSLKVIKLTIAQV